MSTELLDMHLKLLVLEHGRSRVIQSLAHVNEVSEADIESQLAASLKARHAKPAKARPTPDELLARMELPLPKREHLTAMAREFENKRFLGELRLVARFFREHGVMTVPKTRTQALPQVLSILATLPEKELREFIADSVNPSRGSEFAHLAGAIMGE